MDRQNDEVSTYLTQLESSPDRATKHEESRLRSQIRVAEMELYHLDIDLALILAKRARVVHQIQRCRTCLALYSKLPTELIRKIIRLCGPYPQTLPRKDDYSYGRQMPSSWARDDPRLRMTQICSSWRKVAFGIAELWNITFGVRAPHSAFELANAWFRQSFDTPIVLNVDSCPDASYYVVKELIVPYSRRITTLTHLDVDLTDYSNLTLSPFDSFTKLHLNLKYYDGARDATLNYDRLNAPEIQRDLYEMFLDISVDEIILSALPFIALV